MNKYNNRESHIGMVLYCILVVVLFGMAARGFKQWQPAPDTQPKVHIQMGYMGLPSPPECAHLYNVSKHREWADCMGVGYK